MLNACKGKIRIQVVERGGEGCGGDFAQNFSIQHCTENIYTHQHHSCIHYTASYPYLYIIFFTFSSLQLPYTLTYHFLYLLLFTVSLLPYISFSLSSPLYNFFTSLQIIFFIFSSVQFPYFLTYHFHVFSSLQFLYSFFTSLHIIFFIFSSLQFPSFLPL